MFYNDLEYCRTSGRLHHYVRDGDNTLLILGGVGNVPPNHLVGVVNWMF